MIEVNAKWDNALFGIDEDGKLKLIMEVENLEKTNAQVKLILAANCLAQIIQQNGLKPEQVFSVAQMQSYQKVN